jgi:hypothetical protein
MNTEKNESTLHPLLSDFRNIIAFWKVLRPCFFVLLVDENEYGTLVESLAPVTSTMQNTSRLYGSDEGE